MNQLIEDLKSYCSYEDLKDLYAKVMPPLAQFEDKMLTMATEYE